MNDNIIKMFIGGEEVVSNKEFTINEEMLSASSTILNNCYPASWEESKDYVSNFYYPKDYSKFILGKGNFTYGTDQYSILSVSGETFMQFTTNVEKEWSSFNVYGNTYQETRSGKNLLKYPYYATLPTTQAGVTWSDDNGKIIASGTATGYSGFTLVRDIPVQANTNYRFYIVGTQTNVSIDISGTGLGINIPTTSLNNSGFVFNTGNATAITLNVKRQNSLPTSANFYPMLVIGTDTSTDYEPYGVMPSPDYPSELVNVGYKNYFTLDYITAAGITKNDSEKNDFTYTDCWARDIVLNANIVKMLKPSTTYTIKYKYQVLERPSSFGQYNSIYNFGLYNGSRMIWLGITNKNSIDLNTWETITAEFTTPASLTNYRILAYDFKDTNNNTTGIIRISELIITEKERDFIPFGKYGIEVKTTGKNLFDEKYELGTIDTTNGELVNSSSIIRTSNYINIKKSQNYVLSLPEQVAGIILYFYNNGNYLYYSQPQIVNHKVIFTNGVQPNQVKWRFNTGYTILQNETMLEQGTQATEYETYQENIQVYQLDEPLRAIGDIKDKLYIENGMLYVDRKIGSVVLNGTESEWKSLSTTTGLYRYNLPYIYLKPGYKNALCNYFTMSEETSFANITSVSFATHSNEQLFCFFTNETTLDNWKNWLSTHNTEVQYVLNTPYTEEIGQVNIPYSYEEINNTTFDTGIDTEETIYYYWKNYDILFAGIVKNSGDISLKPTNPKYCSLQILDYKTFLSESDTLDFVISDKTIAEAISMVVDAISGYGFVLGTIDISQADDIIGAYSTLNKTAYDVFQYLANISGSRWRARFVDSDTMAIDFYDPELLPRANDIDYTQQYWEDNKIVDLTFNYGTRDYRNKQIILSDEVYGGIDYTEVLLSNGYGTSYITQNNIANITSITVNGVEAEVITQSEKDLGVDADFYYTPGKNVVESTTSYTAGTQIIITYTPLVKGRQIVYNDEEVTRIATQTNTTGVISRYESRNDILSSDELENIAESYIKYKGKPEIILKLTTLNNDLFNIGEICYFNSPIADLAQDYMVKSKATNYTSVAGETNIFYTYELTSSFNSEKAINYFDNQRNKATGNIAEGESITRNIDINNSAMIIWENATITEISVSVDGDNALNSVLNSPFIQ